MPAPTTVRRAGPARECVGRHERRRPDVPGHPATSRRRQVPPARTPAADRAGCGAAARRHSGGRADGEASAPASRDGWLRRPGSGRLGPLDEAGDPIRRRPEVVAVAELRLASMHGDADPQLADLLPRRPSDRGLDRQRRVERRRRPLEDGPDAVARPFDDVAAVPGHDLAQRSDRDARAHPTSPSRRAARARRFLDVRSKERDCLGRQLRHVNPSPGLASTHRHGQHHSSRHGSRFTASPRVGDGSVANVMWHGLAGRCGAWRARCGTLRMTHGLLPDHGHGDRPRHVGAAGRGAPVPRRGAGGRPLRADLRRLALRLRSVVSAGSWAGAAGSG